MASNGTPERDMIDAIESMLLGGEPTLTRRELVDRTGLSAELTVDLWRLLGFSHAGEDDIAFTEADVRAIRLSMELMSLGIISPDSQAAFVRTWARSFARLAEWETSLIAGLAMQRQASLLELSNEVLPRVEELQSYVWRRHLASAVTHLLSSGEGDAGVPLAICFVDIVGYTSRSMEMDEVELVNWIEHFENEVTGAVVDLGGRVIKTIGDEVLFVADDPRRAVQIALTLTGRGETDSDPFPSVRAGVAFGSVVRRLGDVVGHTVNIAARLTSLARPGTLLANVGVHDLLCPDHAPLDTRAIDLAFRRLKRTSAKGYPHLQAWAVRPAR